LRNRPDGWKRSPKRCPEPVEGSPTLVASARNVPKALNKSRLSSGDNLIAKGCRCEGVCPARPGVPGQGSNLHFAERSVSNRRLLTCPCGRCKGRREVRPPRLGPTPSWGGRPHNDMREVNNSRTQSTPRFFGKRQVNPLATIRTSWCP